MRVLGISLFVTVSCALFSGAIPFGLKNRNDVLVNARAENLPDILHATISELTAVKNNVAAISSTTPDAAAAAAKDSLVQVKSILSNAVEAVKVSANVSANLDIGKLLTAIVTLISEILLAVQKFLGGGAGSEISSLSDDIGGLLSNLLELVSKLLTTLVPGLLKTVANLLGGVVGTLRNLNLLNVLAVLGVNV